MQGRRRRQKKEKEDTFATPSASAESSTQSAVTSCIERPAGAADDADMVALQNLPGVYTVRGPMCYWHRTAEADEAVTSPDPRRRHYAGAVRRRGQSLARKQTQFVTNSKCLAEALDSYAGGSFHRSLPGATASYPPKLVAAVFQALKKQLLEDGELNELDIKYGGPVPSQPTFDFEDERLQEDFEKFWDNISGEELPNDLVKKARREEIDWVRSIGLYDKVPRSEATSRNIAPLKIRWVDVNKGDRSCYNVRSRLVGKELRAKTKGSLLAHELFSAMPPWEMVKSLLSLLVTDGVFPEPQVLGVFDISRAHFMAPASRELYVEIPEEDQEPGEPDVVGRLNRSMYGFRDASHNWMEDWQALLQEEGYSIGIANPALFCNQQLSSRGAVQAVTRLQQP